MTAPAARDVPDRRDALLAPPAGAAEYAERLIRRAAVTAVVSCAVVTLVGFGNERTFENRLLDPNEEYTPFQWVSVTMTLLAAFAAAWYAVTVGDRRRMLVLSGVISYFALDDAVELHERVAHHIADPIGGWYANVAFRIWIVLLLPLMVTAFLLLVRFATRALPAVRLAILAGLAGLVAAVGLEGAGIVTLHPRFLGFFGRAPNELRVVVEEGIELGAWILLAAGLYAEVSARQAMSRAERSSDAHDLIGD